MAKERKQKSGPQSDQPASRPADNLPNPTANVSLTDPGQPPAEAGAPATSGSHHAPVGRTMASPRTSAGAGSADESGLIPEIPWDPTGKIDDEVERRTLGSPKGGGQNPQSGNTGPGRYGGTNSDTPSPNRYAGASDDAPTSPTAGATTTLASLTAEETDHEMRQGASSGPTDTAETWQGGQATQEAMQAGDEFGNESVHRSNTPDWEESSGSNPPGERRRVEQYGGGGGYSEVY
jgi:hypothetical protein